MSNPESMQQLAERFNNDAEFRKRTCQDHEGTAESTGLPLDDKDRQALHSMDWKSSD